MQRITLHNNETCWYGHFDPPVHGYEDIPLPWHSSASAEVVLKDTQSLNPDAMVTLKSGK